MQFPLLSFAVIGLALVAISARAATLYVDVNCANPAPPYATWSTAATNIQDAVDAAGEGSQILVNDGVYQTGGGATSDGTTNRVAVTKPLTLQSAKLIEPC
jgi:hypothetical protein